MSISAIWLLLIAAVAQSQPQDLKYDSAKVVRVLGRVDDVRDVAAPPEVKGVHITVESDESAALQVFVGPASFLKVFKFKLEKGDVVSILGSRVRYRGGELILARQVRKGNDTLELRDESGRPHWQDERLKRSLDLPESGALSTVPAVSTDPPRDRRI